VLILKRPIRGNRSHTEAEIDQSIIMDTWYIKGVMDDGDKTRIIS
jgi:hypothetical protein